MAHNLHALYSYVISRLTLANLRNDVSILEEADRLIRPIREAWVEIVRRCTRGEGLTRTLAAVRRTTCSHRSTMSKAATARHPMPDPVRKSPLLQYYEAIEQASADMLEAARVGNWDRARSSSSKEPAPC